MRSSNMLEVTANMTSTGCHSTLFWVGLLKHPRLLFKYIFSSIIMCNFWHNPQLVEGGPYFVEEQQQINRTNLQFTESQLNNYLPTNPIVYAPINNLILDSYIYWHIQYSDSTYSMHINWDWVFTLILKLPLNSYTILYSILNVSEGKKYVNTNLLLLS